MSSGSPTNHANNNNDDNNSNGGLNMKQESLNQHTQTPATSKNLQKDPKVSPSSQIEAGHTLSAVINGDPRVVSPHTATANELKNIPQYQHSEQPVDEAASIQKASKPIIQTKPFTVTQESVLSLQHPMSTHGTTSSHPSYSNNNNGNNVEDPKADHIQAYAMLDFDDFTFYVQTMQILLGRLVEGDTSTEALDIHLGQQKAISRRHAKIFYNFGNQRFELSVIGRNGAFVDDLFVEYGLTLPLKDKTRIQIGETHFRFILPNEESMPNSKGMKDKKNNPINPSDAVNLKTSLYSKNGGGSGGSTTPNSRESSTTPQKAKPQKKATSTSDGKPKLQASPSKAISKPKPNLPSPSPSANTLTTATANRASKATTKKSSPAAALSASQTPLLNNGPQLHQPVLKVDNDFISELRANAEASVVKREEAAAAAAAAAAASKNGKPPGIPTTATSSTLKKAPPPVKPSASAVIEGINSLTNVTGLSQAYQTALANHQQAQALAGITITPQMRKEKPKKQAKQAKKIYKLEEIPQEYRSKPNFSYSTLITECLKAKGTERGMSLSEIYKGIQDLYPYFKYCPDGWQSSVRHNLSLNKSFKKISKEGKGWLWGLDELYFAEKEKNKQKQIEVANVKAVQLQQQSPLSGPTPTGSIIPIGNQLGKPSPMMNQPPKPINIPLPPRQQPVSTAATPVTSSTPTGASSNSKLSGDTKKALSYLQQELIRLTKDRKMYDKETTTQILTQALAMTIAQVNQAAKNAGIQGSPLVTLIEKNPSHITKILTAALNAATLQITKKKGIDLNSPIRSTSATATPARPAPTGSPAPPIPQQFTKPQQPPNIPTTTTIVPLSQGPINQSSTLLQPTRQQSLQPSIPQVPKPITQSTTIKQIPTPTTPSQTTPSLSATPNSTGGIKKPQYYGKPPGLAKPTAYSPPQSHSQPESLQISSIGKNSSQQFTHPTPAPQQQQDSNFYKMPNTSIQPAGSKFTQTTPAAAPAAPPPIPPQATKADSANTQTAQRAIPAGTGTAASMVTGTTANESSKSTQDDDDDEFTMMLESLEKQHSSTDQDDSKKTTVPEPKKIENSTTVSADEPNQAPISNPVPVPAASTVSPLGVHSAATTNVPISSRNTTDAVTTTITVAAASEVQSIPSSSTPQTNSGIISDAPAPAATVSGNAPTVTASQKGNNNPVGNSSTMDTFSIDEFLAQHAKHLETDDNKKRHRDQVEDDVDIDEFEMNLKLPKLDS